MLRIYLKAFCVVFFKSGWFVYLLTAFSISSPLYGRGQNRLQNYETFYALMQDQQETVVAIRKFDLNGESFLLTVNPSSLITKILPLEKQKIKQDRLSDILDQFHTSSYARVIKEALSNAERMEDSGIIHDNSNEKGINLTIDLCPSHKPLDRIVFEDMLSVFDQNSSAIPVAISISGKFLETHQSDIDWLKKLENKGKLKITWINHTLNHFYNKFEPLKQNFLLKADTDMDQEVLGNEKLMIESGLLPSVFFRFPGLVSDFSLFQKVLTYGLIPVGSDAWLAKGQPAIDGSIVLIHGNGNEPVGINDFLKLIQVKKSQIMQHKWDFFDLRESILDE